MVDSAQYFLAMSYYNQDDFFLAGAEFQRLVNSYPGSPFVDDGQYMMGLCYFKAAPKNYGLDQDELPSQSNTWINKHVQYTHVYGYVMCPVSEALPTGRPVFYVKDILIG